MLTRNHITNTIHAYMMNRILNSTICALLILFSATAHAANPTRNSDLAEEWTPNAGLMRAYKQNYFLFYSQSSLPNNAPTSPNPSNQVPYTYPLDNKEMKYQLSVKAHMLGENRHTLWFGYTQLSFWQIYDSAHSTPFRESNYEPEVIYSFRPEHPIHSPGMDSSLLNVGFVHQSNGQMLPRSRGWNRVYIQVGLERDFGEYGKLKLLPLKGAGVSAVGGVNLSSNDIVNALQALGYNEKEADWAAKQLPKDATVSDGIRQALKLLSKA